MRWAAPSEAYMRPAQSADRLGSLDKHSTQAEVGPGGVAGQEADAWESASQSYKWCPDKRIHQIDCFTKQNT